MNNKILVIGAAFVDIVMNVGSLPERGGDATAEVASTDIGGCAFNVYGALVRAGAEATLLAPLGKGRYADMVREKFTGMGISLTIQDDRADNGWDLCLVEADGERTFITIQGIEQHWSSMWFTRLDLVEYQYFYLSGYELENIRSAKKILRALHDRRRGCRVLFDASPRISHVDETIVQKIIQAGTLVHCNEDELKHLCGGEGVEQRMRNIYLRTATPVVVTLSNRGACVLDERGARVIPADRVPIVNTIGAGDTHCAGILAGLQRGANIDEAVALGNQLAELVIQQESGCLHPAASKVADEVGSSPQ